jgi:ribosome-binding ATPase YchF (GTP1/OBG family)|tara:strand:- start:603 stop:845 length:243 start_codon:yes stop_codon:yes gene_type:complete
MNEEYVRAYIAIINSELQAKILEMVGLKAQMQMMKEQIRNSEEARIALEQQLNLVVNTTEDTYEAAPVAEIKKSSSKKKV